MDKTKKKVIIFGWYDLLVITVADYPHSIVVNVVPSIVYVHD